MHVVEAHLCALDALGRNSGRICLITDTLQREMDRAGRITDTLDLMHGVTLPPPDSAWDWEIAPFGEADRHHRLIHRVQTYPDWAEARARS